MSDSPSYAITLLLLSPPLGWLGFHHFYLGNRRRGLAYVLLFLTGIPVLLSAIDTIIILKRGREKFIEKHCSEEKLEQYYVQELMKRRPDLVTRTPAERQKYISNARNEGDFSIEEDENDDVENKEDESGNEESGEEEDEPSYSDYYGNWE